MPKSLLERIGILLYIVDPTEEFSTKDDVPNYPQEVVYLLFFFILLEAGIKLLQGKQVRVNEAFSSLAAGIMHETTVFIAGAIMFFGYEWLYDRRFFDLPWKSSLVTWFATFLFIDFIYYWIHRANHEINFLWAIAHQMHHSAEDYNLSMALRVSVFQRALSWGFYQPLALFGFPFPVVLSHAGLNFIFQFWVHTELIQSLGPLEYVFMTPSHHRVHHGANKWCLDKNYGSVFILWDRLFGTFEAERLDEPIVYGLTTQLQTHNPIWHEYYHIKEIFVKAKSMETWGDTFKALFYGPGWVPGAPRLGDPDTFPDVQAPREKYNPILPLWHIWYCVTHLFCTLILNQVLIHRHLQEWSSWLTICLYIIFIFASVGIFGGMYDGRSWAPPAEALRCALYTAYARTVPVTNIPILDATLYSYYAVSMIFWTSRTIFTMKPYMKMLKLA
ncbi:alkylglycerol monooxygenase-like [Macrobrachium rosenbergii]|uniref:alkylglycerol monooxygenase-like n=1 Tax=Macrobrachium rosenbergii TaxID=79674 RepID=UPI0034D78CA4